MSKTIILTCKHTSNWLKPHIMEDVINNNDYYHISNWPVHNPDGIYQSGQFYMLYIGAKTSFIMMRGKFESAAHRNLYLWKGAERQNCWVGLNIEQFIHYTRGPILEVSQLSKTIPEVDWNGDFSELTLSRENSEKLELLWQHHVERHASEFQTPALVRHFEEEYEKMGIGKRARKKIIGVEKLSKFMDDGTCFHDAVVQKMEYDRDKNEMHLLIDTYCIPYNSKIKSTYLITFLFKDVVEIKMNTEPHNDYIWHTRIYQNGNFITAEFESAHLEVCSSELEIGEVVEQKVK